MILLTSSLTPPVTAGSPYTAGNVVGGLLPFVNVIPRYYCTLSSISITIASKQSEAYALYLFRDNPSASTWTDFAAPAINAADVSKVLGVFGLTSYDNGLGSAFTVYNLENINKPLYSLPPTLYGILITGAPMTFTTTSDLTITVGVLEN